MTDYRTEIDTAIADLREEIIAVAGDLDRPAHTPALAGLLAQLHEARYHDAMGDPRRALEVLWEMPVEDEDGGKP